RELNAGITKDKAPAVSPNAIRSIPAGNGMITHLMDQQQPSTAAKAGTARELYSYSLDGSTDRDRLGTSSQASMARYIPSRDSSLSPAAPMIIRTASLSITTKDFDSARSHIEDILKRHHGYIGSLAVAGAANSGRTLTACLRIPSSQLDPALAEL